MGKRAKATGFVAALMMMLVSTTARAQFVGYELTISGSTNVPTFTLTNTSTSSDEISGFSVTIGDTSRNWDSAIFNAGASSSGLSFTLLTPDTNDGGVLRDDVFDYDFTAGFVPGAVFVTVADVDIDNSNTTQDYRNVLFNNGTAPNSVITVEFSGGIVLNETMPDFASVPSPVVFGQSAPIPEPSTFVLSVLGLASLFAFHWRKRKAGAA